MQKIIPYLWFDTQAVEAARFYASVFPDSEVIRTSAISGTPSGDVDIVRFRVMDLEIEAMSAGPYFKINPSVSFMVNFDPSRMDGARAKLDEIWGKLIEGGKALMPIDAYPFSARYGWVEDKYGVSWQLILTNPEGEERPSVIPSLLFTNERSGKAKEASDLYLSVFGGSKRGALAPFPAATGQGQKEGDLMFTDFMLEGQWFAAMDGGNVHGFGFNEAVSFMVSCADQAEIDRYWAALSAVPEAEQCGWLKDAYGVSWQIVPEEMGRMMKNGTPEQRARVTQAFLKMKKFDVAELQRAYDGA